MAPHNEFISLFLRQEKEAVFPNVLCSLHSNALLRERKQKLVLEGNVLHTRDWLHILDTASVWISGEYGKFKETNDLASLV